MVPVSQGTAPLPVPSGQVLVAMAPQRLRCDVASCVALILFDLELKLAAMAHVLRPDSRGSVSSGMAAKHADRAVPAAIAALVAHGAARWRLEAMLVGAAVDPALPGLGPRNVDAVRSSLAGHAIPVNQEDLGGQRGRRVTFDPRWGELTVELLERL